MFNIIRTELVICKLKKLYISNIINFLKYIFIKILLFLSMNFIL